MFEGTEEGKCKTDTKKGERRNKKNEWVLNKGKSRSKINKYEWVHYIFSVKWIWKKLKTIFMCACGEMCGGKCAGEVCGGGVRRVQGRNERKKKNQMRWRRMSKPKYFEKTK